MGMVEHHPGVMVLRILGMLTHVKPVRPHFAWIVTEEHWCLLKTICLPIK